MGIHHLLNRNWPNFEINQWPTGCACSYIGSIVNVTMEGTTGICVNNKTCEVANDDV